MSAGESLQPQINSTRQSSGDKRLLIFSAAARCAGRRQFRRDALMSDEVLLRLDQFQIADQD